jgi:hypothetical protein
LAHLSRWTDAYQRERSRQGIHPSADVPAAVLYTWAAELGLGVLEALGIEPPSRRGWADAHNRFARGLQLPADRVERPPPVKAGKAR